MSGDIARVRVADSEPRVFQLAPTLTPEFLESWRALAARLPGTSFFQTPEWVLAWWDSLARRPRTEIACWYDATGELGALVALSRMTERLDRRFALSVPVLANAGSGPGDADHCGPLVSPELETQVAAWLARRETPRALLMRNVAAGGAGPIPHGMRDVGTTTCPRLQLDRATPRTVPSANLRRQLARSRRWFDRMGVTFTWLRPGSVDDEIVAALRDLHVRRRESLGASTNVQRSHTALLTALSASASSDRGPAAVVGRLGCRVVGVLVGFRWGRTFSAYQSGWDPEFGAQSLGSVLVDTAIEMSSQDGVETFDFLRGTEPYKYRFGAVNECDHSYLLVRGPAGRALDLTHRLRGSLSRAR